MDNSLIIKEGPEIIRKKQVAVYYFCEGRLDDGIIMDFS